MNPRLQIASLTYCFFDYLVSDLHAESHIDIFQQKHVDDCHSSSTLAQRNEDDPFVWLMTS